MPVVIRIIGLVVGDSVSPFDDQYIVEYDPSRPGRSDGIELTYHLLTTQDIESATQYPDVMAALCVYQKFAEGHEDSDGEPYRPLTAFHVEFETIELEPSSEIFDGC